MNKEQMFEVVKAIPFDKKDVVFQEEESQIYLFRPSKLSKRFKEYDLTKNFQIWLKEGTREFRPNHLRLFIDLNLRIRSTPKMKRNLLLAFDNIFYGKDPEEELKELSEVKFDHFLNKIIVIGTLAQLFIIEQEYCYSKESNYDPPTLFFQGWVRQFIDSPKEIDNMCMSVARFQPPSASYTKRENKKNNEYSNDLKPLWYLKDDEQLTL